MPEKVSSARRVREAERAELQRWRRRRSGRSGLYVRAGEETDTKGQLAVLTPHRSDPHDDDYRDENEMKSMNPNDEPRLTVLIETAAKWASAIFDEIAINGEASVQPGCGDFLGPHLRG